MVAPIRTLGGSAGIASPVNGKVLANRIASARWRAAAWITSATVMSPGPAWTTASNCARARATTSVVVRQASSSRGFMASRDQ